VASAWRYGQGDVSFRKSRQPYLEGRPGYLGVVRGFRRLAEVRKKRTIDTDGPDQSVTMLDELDEVTVGIQEERGNDRPAIESLGSEG
jgi:hypothetical protein